MGLLWILFSDAAIYALGLPAHIEHLLISGKDLVAVTVTTVLVYDISRRYTQKTEDAFRRNIEASHDLIERLVMAGEFRDDDTGNHNRRIGEYSCVIGLELGLPEDECELLYYGAKLHDVGKIGVPDSILRKEGPLTPDERAIMERHVLFGASILGGAHTKHIEVARTIALSHHEAWNGTGYPNKLVGVEIPLEGRIVAVCDVYDALTSARPYKDAWTEEAALKEIRRLSGIKFDPMIVEAFEVCLPELQRIRHESSSPVAESLRLHYPLPVISKQHDTCLRCKKQVCPVCVYRDKAA